MFKTGDTVVVNGSDIGQIVDITKRDLGQQICEFYIVEKRDQNARLMIPTNTKDRIRSLPSEDEINEVFTILSCEQYETDILVQKRKVFFSYLEKNRFKGAKEVASILRTLTLLKKKKGLSTAEKKLYTDCHQQLITEVSLAQKKNETEIEVLMDTALEKIFSMPIQYHQEASASASI